MVRLRWNPAVLIRDLNVSCGIYNFVCIVVDIFDQAGVFFESEPVSWISKRSPYSLEASLIGTPLGISDNDHSQDNEFGLRIFSVKWLR